MIIRAENASDHNQIYNINYEAFQKEIEPKLVSALRASKTFVPELSLVALVGDKIVGHILFTEITIKKEEGHEETVLSLAPLAVLPMHQKQGVGLELVRKGLEECKRLGYTIVVVVGHPEYYPRFGFVSARGKGLEAPFPVPDAAFMVIGLVPGALDGICGMVIYPPEFGL